MRGTQTSIWALGCRLGALEVHLTGMRRTHVSIHVSCYRWRAEWQYGWMAGGCGGYLPSGLRGAIRGSPRPAEDNRPLNACYLPGETVALLAGRIILTRDVGSELPAGQQPLAKPKLWNR